MITIDLEENDDVVVVAEKFEDPIAIPTDFEFKRKLVLQVRKHRILYDNKHKLFANSARKDIVWQQIASKLNSYVEKCKDTWYELRYNYQRHGRKLRYYFAQGHKENRKRPAMLLESELMFLWRFIQNPKTCEIAFEIVEEQYPQTANESTATTSAVTPVAVPKPIDDDLILVETPVELIVIDEDDDNNKDEKQFKLNGNMKNLIAVVKTHPELYDSKHADFNNYTRKSFLWNAIASSMSDKATKLMKCWIVLQTRFEWEICQQKQTAGNNKPSVSELQKELSFLKDFILNNPNTVYKQSYFLKSAWYDPIDYFKDIYNLIVRMKKMSDIVHVTDSLIKTPEKSKQYISLWKEVSNSKNNSPGQCETTWLIMRYFYWELMNMRSENYQLTDKWYFETIITELYAISKTAQTAKLQELEILKSNKHNKQPTKRLAQTNPITLGAPANKSASPISTPPPAVPITAPTISNFQSLTTTNTTFTTQPAVQPTLTLPRITAAISLAPQALQSGTLQIKQISGPPALSPAPFQVNGTRHTPSAAPPKSVPTQMSFNLPTQTKVTPITMPALIRPLTANHTQPKHRKIAPATISVRSLPQIQIASWATATGPSFDSNVVTQIHTNLQQPLSTLPTSTSINSYVAPHMPTTMQPPTVPPPKILNSSLGAMTPFNQQNTQSSNSSKQNTLPISSTNSVQAVATYTTTAPLSNTTTTTPSNVVVPLSVHLSTNANTNTDSTTDHLVPVEASSSQLPKIAGAISVLNPNEILIELISSHSGNHLLVHGPPLNAKYQLTMQTVAKFIREMLAIPMLHTKQRVPLVAINHFWEHISETFSLPVHICRAIWNFLLENFDHFPQIAPMKELMKPFHTPLKVWITSFKLFEQFESTCVTKGWNKYSKSFPDVVDSIKSYPVLYQDVSKAKKSEKLTDMESLCSWRTIGLRFPKNSEIEEIWTALKTCFLQYLSDLEIGLDNKWSINWWRSLARMKFLVEARYATNNPFYYIISNKMQEEIDRFATMEMKNRSKIAAEENNAIDAGGDPNNVEMEIKASVIPAKEKVKEVELVALLTNIQKYPAIYTSANTLVKFEAWQQVARQLGMEVPDCLFAFKNAAEKYLTYKKKDSAGRLQLHERYYKRFDEIVQSMPSAKLPSAASHSRINIRTPFELNQSVEKDNSSDLVFPERYISDINMTNCPSELVVKNWVYAVGNIGNVKDSLATKLRKVLMKYLPKVT